MRIKKLYIKKFKNIEEQTLMFDTSNSYCALIGLNGSGKSNWLEAVSLIFQGIYTSHKTPFEYEIEYEHDGQAYLYRNGQAYQEDIKKKDSEIFRPRIFACYSGEELRLWQDAFESYYMSFFNRAIKNELSEPEMMFVNKYSWSLALISLMCSEDPGVKAFLKANLGIEDLTLIDLKFKINRAKLDAYKETDVKKLLNRLHADPDGIATIAMSELATYDIGARTNLDLCQMVFYYLYLSSIPKANSVNRVDKAIEGIDIVFENGTSLKDLSEGEKKMILVHCITRILADDNSVVLFDEPDAHVHLDRKKGIIDCFSVFPGQIIFTTHSPVLSSICSNLKYVDRGEIKSTEFMDVISTLSDNRISLISGALMMSSTNPLILVEGPGDIEYIETAIDVLGKTNPVYKNLKWDFLHTGGTGNTKRFADRIKPHVPIGKPVIVLLDRDVAGADAMKSFGIEGGQEKMDTYKKDNWYFLMLPKTAAHTETDFLIEDYFPKQIKHQIATDKINEADGHFNKYIKNLREHIKTTLMKDLKSRTESDLSGFAVLLDKLIAIVNGAEATVPIP